MLIKSIYTKISNIRRDYKKGNNLNRIHSLAMENQNQKNMILINKLKIM